MAVVVVSAPNIPNTVTGAGTTAQLFGPKLQVPGSSRLDGQTFNVVLGGSIFPNTASNAQLTVWANYPNINGSPQYPNCSITSAIMTNNVATINGSNNFVAGQYVSITGMANANLNGTAGPLLSANATAFTVSNINGATLAIANISNASQTNCVAAINAVPFYTANVSPTLTVNTYVPFNASVRCLGDVNSNVLTGFGQDFTVNVNASANGTAAIVPNLSTGTVVPVPGVNFKNEPPVYFTVSETFGASSAGNSAVLKQFILES